MVAQTPEERLAVAEANIASLFEVVRETNGSVKELATTVGGLARELAEFAATLRHPSKDHCVMVDEVEEVKRRHEKEVDALTVEMADMKKENASLKERADKFEGGIKVIIALIGGGSLLTIISIIGGIVWLANQFAGKGGTP